MRVLLLFVSIFFFVQAKTQTVRPVYVLANGAVTINCDSWLVDPDSLRGNYSFGTTTMTISSSGGSRIGIYADSIFLKDDYEYINIYDGPATTSPLIASYTRTSRNNDGFVSSAGSLTIKFFATGGSATGSPGWRLKLSCVSPVTNIADFTPIRLGVEQGNISLSDYDKDGDKDMLVAGRVYRNDSKDDSFYVFDRLLKPVDDWKSSSSAAADFDNDGFKDVFIAGEKINSSGSVIRTAAIYKNLNGSFSPVTGLTFPGVSDAAVSLLDFNNDGKTDIAYTGTTGTANIFKLYLNNGSWSFTEKVLNIPGKTFASMSWRDYDNDGDLDLLYNGLPNDVSAGTGLYINSANTSFSYFPMIMFQRNSGEIKWVDVNNDGRLDIFSTGLLSSGAEPPEIMFNNGNNNFSRFITSLPIMGFTSQDWVDYDGDGDLDLLLNGYQFMSAGDPIVAFYKNTGNGSFIQKPLYNITSSRPAKWIHVNNDSKWDIFISGHDISPSVVLKNMGLDSFQSVSYPFSGYRTGSAIAEDFDNNGSIDFLFAGTITDRQCNEEKTSVYIKGLGWKIFPVARTTPVANLNMNFNWVFNPGPSGEHWSWGDVDNDGKDDIILTNNPRMGGGFDPLRIFRNNGNDSFSLIFTGTLAGGYNLQAAVVDMNNDGINELYVTPNKVFRWNGSGFNLLYDDNVPGCSSGCTNVFASFADFDLDGYVDLAYSEGNYVKIFRNNQNGRFVNTNFNWYLTWTDKFVHWKDLDSDGDPDLLLTGHLLENTVTGFRVRKINIPNHGHTAFGDFNKDGSPDIFTLPYSSSNTYARLYYGQQNKLFFEDKTPLPYIPAPPNVNKEGVEVFDIDKDGDDDLIYATGVYCYPSGVYINNQNMRTANIVVRSPNGNEQIQIGTTQAINWIGNDISPAVKIELSLDSGITWSIITAAATSGKYDGQFNWNTTGYPVSNKAIIRITDNATSSVVDKSDRTFRLTLATSTPIVRQGNDTRIYPNPVSKTLVLESNKFRPGKKIKALIYTSGGVLVSREEISFSGGKTMLYLGNLPAGLYFVNITDDKKTEVHKLVKL
jgi:hypothetical protein